MAMERVSLHIVQSVCTKPRMYLTYSSYLGPTYDLYCNCFLTSSCVEMHV